MHTDSLVARLQGWKTIETGSTTGKDRKYNHGYDVTTGSEAQPHSCLEITMVLSRSKAAGS